jgi:hypothetical protein
MAKELGKYCWTKQTVLDMSRLFGIVHTMDGNRTTVTIPKTRVWIAIDFLIVLTIIK